MTANPAYDVHTSEPPSHQAKQNLKAWWSHFRFAQQVKKEAEEKKGEYILGAVFGQPLKESLKCASVQISTANANGQLYVWGRIPVVVAKCGLYLKENATEVEGTFRVNGSTKRMRELQAAFQSPPDYGKKLDWKKENYTTHDVASVFRRFLTQMPEPVIPHDMYHHFRDALAHKPYNQDEVIQTYKRLIRAMPRSNQYLLLYVLDLLSVFARKSDKNLMTAKNLAVIFRPALIAHPSHELSPQEHQLSQEVLEFLIAHQDWFMLDIPPPPSLSDSPHTIPTTPVDSGSDDEQGWKLVNSPRRIVRRRTTTERSSEKHKEGSDLSPVQETPPSRRSSRNEGSVASVTRSRTLPSSKHRHTRGMSDEERGAKLHKKNRASLQPAKRPATATIG
ncbi:Rho GTPase activation protein [Fomitopsis betulina]|nr:Rho GTPase activation protein [Fomitopsis betulina]